MRLLHTADWHIGKELGEFSLLAEQQAAFEQIVQLAKQYQVDGVIIAGDLYDRAIPSLAAMAELERELRVLNIAEGLPIYAVSGNHDGATRLGAGAEWRAANDLFLNTTLAGAFTPIELADTQIYLLPFIDPTDARIYYQRSLEEYEHYASIEQVMPDILSDMEKSFDPAKRHVLVTHYYVSGPGNENYELTSETNSKVGGLKNLAANLFDAFDYVALGHLHLKQASPSEKIKYAGSPIKFNTKEASNEKGVYLVDLDATGLKTTWLPLQTKKDLIVLHETYATLIDPDFYQKYERQGANYFSIKLQGFTKEQTIRQTLTEIYGDIVELQYDVTAINEHLVSQEANDLAELDDVALIERFYQDVSGTYLDNDMKAVIQETMIALRRDTEEA